MDKISIFLACSKELLAERQQFEIEIHRKNNSWVDKGIYLQLEIWEDKTAALLPDGSQDALNEFARNADIFVLLAHTRVNIYSDQEFENAFGRFRENLKPFIFTYFKEPVLEEDESLGRFKQKLWELKHFHAVFKDAADLWNQFNKELDRLSVANFEVNNWDRNMAWVQSLKQGFKEQGISVSSQPRKIFQHYGWLVETFLDKMCTIDGRKIGLRRLSFLSEAFQASLRYLCYIQMGRLLQSVHILPPVITSAFIHMKGSQYLHFDYMQFLLDLTHALEKNSFIREIDRFTRELTSNTTDLYRTAKRLEETRQRIINNNIPENDSLFDLHEQHLADLVYWLRKLAFLAKYRLVSIKDINLSYKLGTPKNFVHLYGELHGVYDKAYSDSEEYNTKSIEDCFTYNQSILLFRGSDINTCLDQLHDNSTYISLSPLLIDQSVFAGKPTQTPELFYFSGYDEENRCYQFQQYRNELAYGGRCEILSNNTLEVFPQNNDHPWLDELFEHLEQVFGPFKKLQS